MNSILPADLLRRRHDLTARPLALLLDCDGTLAPIAQTPERARIPSATKRLLTALVRLAHTRLAVISGRPRRDLDRLIAIPGIALVGGHGAEFLGADPKACPAGTKALLTRLARKVRLAIAAYPDALLEIKPASFAVHFRRCSPVKARRVQVMLDSLCAAPRLQGRISLLDGKMMREVMPPRPANKGQAVRLLLRQWDMPRVLPVYIGDDTTDETAFLALRRHGICIRVGPPESVSAAPYRLASPLAVRSFLSALLRWRTGVPEK